MPARAAKEPGHGPADPSAIVRALAAELVLALRASGELRHDVCEALGLDVRATGRREPEVALTVAEVAASLNVSERSVYRALRDGRLRGTRIGTCWRISPEALTDWMSRSTAPRSPARQARTGSGSRDRGVARRALAA